MQRATRAPVCGWMQCQICIHYITVNNIISTIDLLDGFYQILMREKDVPPQQSSPKRDAVGVDSDVTRVEERVRDLQPMRYKPARRATLYRVALATFTSTSHCK